MKFPIGKILIILDNFYGKHEFNERNKRDPFKTLVSCILSLRTKDEVTNLASSRLFSVVKNVKDLRRINEKKLSKIVYPVGFYRTKAKRLKEIAKKLLTEYKGVIPSTIKELLKFKGVGRKTANLVVSLGYGKYGICVDTHVHRITNRLGYVKTKTPGETEMALRRKLRRKYWAQINYILVNHGQNICRPINPKCSICPTAKYCRKTGVNINTIR